MVDPRLVTSPQPRADGRQSQAALIVARGVRRVLRARGFSSLTELALSDGRRADIVAVNAEGVIHIIEVKSSIADFRADHKWPDYCAHCDAFAFAIAPAVPPDLIPADVGLFIADGYGAELVRHGREQRLPPATRRAMLIRFAQAAADRLHALYDCEPTGPS